MATKDSALRLALPPLLLAMIACAREPSAPRPTALPVSPKASVEPQPAPGTSACRPVKFPATAAGRRLEQLVAAVNAPDAAAAERFVATAMAAEYAATQPRDRHVQFIRGMHTDGPPVALCRVESSTSDEVVAILWGPPVEGLSEYGRFTLWVDESGRVADIGIGSATKEDLTRPIEKLDDEAVREAVEGVANGLADYVFADKADAMAKRIREAKDARKYAGITNGHVLAWRLTDDLRAVTGDKHLGVMYSASVLEPAGAPREQTPAEVEEFERQAARDNFGMPVAEIREGNVGYLEVLGFHPPEVAAEAVAETMSKLADADVLVIDLRRNGGGSAHGVALMTSYLFGNKRVHLNDLDNRSQKRTESFYTSPDVPGRRFGPKKPIYVLTSAQTFSAGEEFAYNLKARKRATIVGEVTGGGAHPVDIVRVSDHWMIVLPTARAINPVTKTNWEGTGVKPDVEVPAEQALEKALELAAKRKK